ncbi:MAG TPA: hypothetical protein VM452_14750 [Caulifigura sp.]|jgi:hypothetical protein|nr:hypothetical protein [Caulifigura sp.]
MARRAACCFIVAYLGILAYGLSAHTVGYKVYSHLGMYFVVWDMYCGWAGWETRHQILAEGESGRYYDVGQAPWGEVCVYGEADRRHYDLYGLHAFSIARNVARHTEHEPFVRYLVVEEAWSKKYNLPENLWAQRFEEPKDPRVYRRIRAAFEGDGQCVASNGSWSNWLVAQALGDNPRLQKDMQIRTPFMTTDRFTRSPDVIVPVGHTEPSQGTSN